MAGGHHFPYPKWVWSPAGGWWAKPKHWKRDTALFYLAAGTILFGAYHFCEARTKVYMPPPAPTFHLKDDHHGDHH